MATIYRFVIEGKEGSSKGSGGRRSSKPSYKAPAKGHWVGLLASGEKGGVEHNRKMRAINPLLNKMTGGYWEKSMRLGRASGGLVQKNTETGKLRIGGPAIAIIIAMVIKAVGDYVKWLQDRAETKNTSNFKKMQTGERNITSNFEMTVNFISGKQKYNENN